VYPACDISTPRYPTYSEYLWDQHVLQPLPILVDRNDVLQRVRSECDALGKLRVSVQRAAHAQHVVCRLGLRMQRATIGSTMLATRNERLHCAAPQTSPACGATGKRPADCAAPGRLS
jgi:hypothetical protein